jgi:hypothetical protein
MHRLMFGPVLAECELDDHNSPLALSSVKSFERIVHAAGSWDRALAYWALAHGWAQLQLVGLTGPGQDKKLGINQLRRLLAEDPSV